MANCINKLSHKSIAFPDLNLPENTGKKEDEKEIPVNKEPVKNKERVVFKPKNKKHATIIVDKVNKKLYIKTSNDADIIKAISELENSFWINPKQMWILPGNNSTFLEIKHLLFKNCYKYTIDFIKPAEEREPHPVVRKYIKTLKMKNYSNYTIKAYTPWFRLFVNNFFTRDIEKLAFHEIQSFIKYQVNNQLLSDTQTLHLINSIKFYYEKILGYKKLVFHVNNCNKIANREITIPFDIIKKDLKAIMNPCEKLLLVFKFCIGYSEQQISEITMPEVKRILQQLVFTKQPELKKATKSLIKEVYFIIMPKHYLFENRHQQKIAAKIIEERIKQTLQKAKAGIIYKCIFEDVLSQSKYAERTRKNYVSMLMTFVSRTGFIHPERVTNENIEDFLWSLRKDNKYCSSTINQYINVLKFYYCDFLKRDIPHQFFLRPKKAKKLPVILSLQEIKTILNKVENLKHRCMLALIYSGGIRKAEALDIKLKDFDFERKLFRVDDGKGSKDRDTIFSETLKKILDEYIQKYKPKDFLFEGATGGRYSESSIHKVMKNAIKKANLSKKVSLHNLRHSFATHLLESGTDIRVIQKLLGHNSIKTTSIYAHVANKEISKIISPLDTI
ncbi:tyrosine-type recombinase/integrase [Candidatus Dependentiae bacterium]|nr:tyrosine-type recombinase/integrase [Candidatus Dependentiae bacterium]